jgi:aminoglycoside phosphotransferase (APT) family kinase protein
MAVQRYSRHEMQAIISNILRKDVSLVPIGNHELRRHLVYKVKTDEGNFVFKYYYQDVYGGREISTLRMIQNTDIKHARLIDSGTFGEDREWLMMELLEGMPMDKIMKHVPREQLASIYEDMGRSLGQLHDMKTFDGFGSLKEDMTFLKKHDRFVDAFVENNEYFTRKIYDTPSKVKDILLLGVKKIQQNLFLLDSVKEARLTHFDFSPRNTFISKENDKRVLSAILDYELCRPWDKNSDLCHLILRDFPDNSDFEEAFFRGYREHSTLDHHFHYTLDFYMLNLCLSVCSWAETIAPAYYELALNKIIKLINESKNLK